MSSLQQPHLKQPTNENMNLSFSKDQCQVCKASFGTFYKKRECNLCMKQMCKKCSVRRPTIEGSQRFCIECNDQLIYQRIPSSLTESYKRVNQDKQRTEEQIKKQKQREKSLEQEAIDLKQQAKMQKTQVQEIQSEKQGSYYSAQDQQSELVKQNESLRQTLRSLEDQIVQIQQKINKTKRENQKINESNQELGKEVETMKKKMQDEIQVCNEIKSELDTQKQNNFRTSSFTGEEEQ